MQFLGYIKGWFYGNRAILGAKCPVILGLLRFEKCRDPILGMKCLWFLGNVIFAPEDKVKDDFWETSLLSHRIKMTNDLGKCHFCPMGQK